MVRFCLPDILQNSTERYPTKIALVCNDKRCSYEELNTDVTHLARKLVNLGVKKNEAVLISMPNSVEFVVALFAIAKAGGVIVPINPDLSLREFKYICGHCEAKLLITSSENRKILQEILPKLVTRQAVVVLGEKPELFREHFAKEGVTSSRICFPREIVSDDRDVELPRLIDSDNAMIMYTSGSMGQPKAVLLSHLNLMSSVRSVVEYLRLVPEDSALICLPLFHIYTLSQLFTHLACGGKVVLVENFFFPTQVLRYIEQEQLTGLGGTPGSFNLLLSAKSLPNYQLMSLRYLLNSGGPLPERTLLQLMETFPHAEIISAYGLTEASSRVSHCAYRKGCVRRLGSVGKPMPNVEIRVVNAEGNDVQPGEVGEILVRGSTLMKGYFKDEAATARVLKQEGLHTGDFATTDADGYIFIVGRRDDILNSGGESVSAKEVEEILLSHPAVLEAAVVGKPDEVLGEAIQAFLVLKPQVQIVIDDIKDHCLTHLSRYKVPREFIVCNALPKTPSGKVQKHLLRQHAIRETNESFDRSCI